MGPPAALGADDKLIVAAAACADRSLAFPRPFRILAVTTGRRALPPRSPDGPVDEGQDPAVRSLRSRYRRLPRRRQAAWPHRADPVRLPRPQPQLGRASCRERVEIS